MNTVMLDEDILQDVNDDTLVLPRPNTLPLRSTITGNSPHVLIVDDEQAICQMYKDILDKLNISADQVYDAASAMKALGDCSYDLVLLDIHLPGAKGTELLKEIQKHSQNSNLKIIVISGFIPGDEMSKLLDEGVDDFMSKPFSPIQFAARVRAMLRQKHIEDMDTSFSATQKLLNRNLSRTLNKLNGDLLEARNTLVTALSELVDSRDEETGAHLLRLQGYVGILARAAADSPAYHDQINPSFIEMIEQCAILHDIGKVAIPDSILRKQGILTPAEREVMQGHTQHGDTILRKVEHQHHFANAFLKMAAEVARCHHERHDGNGYPDRLTGDQIPLAARMVAIADVYDALRSPRTYKPAFSHGVTVKTMLSGSGQFDPGLLELFKSCCQQFDQLYQQCPEIACYPLKQIPTS